MRKHFSHYSIISLIILISFFLVETRYVYAEPLKEEADSYRKAGYESQERGDMDAAISWYQKAAMLDPNYAAPHNDLGILFEMKGWPDRAESEYQKALTIDPDYAKAHTNLALFYERERKTKKAAFHWMRRYKLGKPGEPWTEEARERLGKMGLIDKAKGIAVPVGRGKKARVKSSRTKVGAGKKALAESESEWTRIGSKKKPRAKKARPGKAKKKQTKIPRSKPSDLNEIDRRLSRVENKVDEVVKLEEAARRLSKAEKHLKVAPGFDAVSNRLLNVEEHIEAAPRSDKVGRKLSEIERKIERSAKISEFDSRIEKVEARLGKHYRAKMEIEKFKERDSVKRSRIKKSGKESKWTKIGYSGKKERSKSKKARVFSSGSVTSDELERSLRLAEERLRMAKKKKPAFQKGQYRGVKTEVDPKVKTYYNSARSYYSKGAYSRALDMIRVAKRDVPDDKALLELEEEIKNRMKEERIEDHYTEGIILYQKKDFSGAKKEFEAMLNVLPE